ncbi:putative glyoxalase superfamily protein PhnB [Luteibacter sp. Sphag1AF]|uniref:VOC family protein n=1 Tax=Luteibacter sp. Sphag1AF TaxID=2587031 RepID=UPI001613CFDD|nr:VOC family protein [Luteibacter sp. Sphag1AF]MBB3227250.1 putative glyoxalase superfamily protein PhnB [Luteibacter sp. Sphag1AF]
MRLGYTLVYVADVEATVDFYERAFGLERRFVHESGQYAEMETGSTALAFAAHGMSAGVGIPVRPNLPEKMAAGIELCLVTDEPESAYERAIAAGAVPVHPVEVKPWGQKVSYVRDLNGCLLEICSPVGA